MWIERNKSGNYRFVERYKDPLTGKGKRVIVTYPNKNKFTAKRAQMVLEAKIQDRLRHIQDGNVKKGVTLGQVIAEWEPIYKAQVKPTTWQTYVVAKKHIEHYIGLDVKVNKITPKFLIHVYEKMLYQDGYNNPTVKMVAFKVNSILRLAYKRDYIATQPTNNLDVNWKKNNRNETVDKFLEQDELDAILNYVYQHDEQQGAIFEWQYLTGMRIGEVLGLQVKDIFQNAGKYYAQVNGTLVYTGLNVDQYYKQSTPKTDDSFRNVFLPKKAVELYHRWGDSKDPNHFLFMINNKFFHLQI